MQGAERAAYRLSCITKPVIGDADPDAIQDTCRGCGTYQLLHYIKRNPKTGAFIHGYCDNESCSDILRQKARDMGKGMLIGGVYYFSPDALTAAAIEALPAEQTMGNAQRAQDLSNLSQRHIRVLRKQARKGEISSQRVREAELHMSTEATVPTCQYDGCRDCPRTGDTLCITHRLQANALQYKLRPPRYRQSQNASTELPSRRRRRGDRRGRQRTGNRIRGFERIK